MNEVTFRLRLCFQKRDRARFLSHLEVVRAMERMVRRAQLPYAVSHGFNTHMRQAPGPALPVGTTGLAELYDVWLTTYLKPAEALTRLQKASAQGLEVLSVTYVSPKAKGLQATHPCEEYEVVLTDCTLDAPALSARLATLIAGGTLTTRRKNKEKVYNLKQAIMRQPEVQEAQEAQRGSGPDASDEPQREGGSHPVQEVQKGSGLNTLIVHLNLRSTEQGSIRPEVLLQAACGEDVEFTVWSVTRTALREDTR
ncbi:MAG: TIGR03936 family radical SAM-associated protein [Coriobacteriales bacterium]|jgi:radical SAM-linked protein|nr:TIGR03936 family radical SAM-associated protein [Coriobacteriales bacterium]